MAQETLGARLKRLRVAKNMSQTALRDASGISDQTIWNIETGRQEGLRRATAERLADALDVPAVYLQYGSDAEHAGQPPPELTRVYTALTPPDRYALLHIGRALREARERYGAGEGKGEEPESEEPRLTEQDQLPRLSPEEVTPELTEEQIRRGIHQGRIAAETPEPNEDEDE